MTFISYWLVLWVPLLEMVLYHNKCGDVLSILVSVWELFSEDVLFWVYWALPGSYWLCYRVRCGSLWQCIVVWCTLIVGWHHAGGVGGWAARVARRVTEHLGSGSPPTASQLSSTYHLLSVLTPHSSSRTHSLIMRGDSLLWAPCDYLSGLYSDGDRVTHHDKNSPANWIIGFSTQEASIFYVLFMIVHTMPKSVQKLW